jgi:hypothetical protein
MQIRVGRRVTKAGPATIPSSLPGSMPALGAPSLTRDITLEQVENPTTGEPEYGSLNGRKFDDVRDVQERPRLGSTEDWRLVNLTEDTDPIHLHLVQFQIVDRRPFDAEGYKATLEQARRRRERVEPRPVLLGPRGGPGRERARVEGHRAHQPGPGHAHPCAVDAAGGRRGAPALRLPLPHPRARGQLDDAPARARRLSGGDVDARPHHRPRGRAAHGGHRLPRRHRDRPGRRASVRARAGRPDRHDLRRGDGGRAAPVAALAARNRRAIAALARCGRPTGAALRRVWRDVRAELLVATTLVVVASVLVAQVRAAHSPGLRRVNAR